MSPRRALSGFFLSGLVMAFPGAALPVWGHHLRTDYTTVGLYFLAFYCGVLLAAVFVRHPPDPARAISAAAAVATVSLAALVFAASPAHAFWRVALFLPLGASAGLLNSATLHAISPLYRQDRAATLNLAGAFFGSGCVAVAALIAFTMRIESPAVLCAILAIAFSRSAGAPAASLRRTSAEVLNPAALLFSALLFFQFANEWSIAGWLPLFLIQRVGMSPFRALCVLALFWTALLLGRLIMQAILPRVRPARVLLASVLAAMFGCAVLALTDNLFGAVLGVLFAGAGFAPVYPLVVEKIGSRFPSYHPGLFNGIFTIALTGGLLAPAVLGWVSGRWGVGVVMLLPMVGSLVVVVLLIAIWLEARFGRLA